MRLPDFLIIGAQKGGTTAASRNLNLHPEIGTYSGTTKFGQREIEFFNQHWTEGEHWYASHFDEDRRLVGEKTAELLHRTICHERMASVVPRAKLLIFLRCPVQRAYSQWRMATRPGWGETRAFEQVVNAELASFAEGTTLESFYRCETGAVSWQEGYLAKGLYFEQIRHLLTYYSRSQVHIAISERVQQNMSREYDRVHEFLGALPYRADYSEHFVGRKAAEMDQSVRVKLTKFYSAHNEYLFHFFGERIGEWMSDEA